MNPNVNNNNLQKSTSSHRSQNKQYYPNTAFNQYPPQNISNPYTNRTNNSLMNSNRVYPQKNSYIKWRNVMKIDLNEIKQTGNFSMLEAYLNNMIYSDISEEEIQSVPENNIAKLVSILQFTANNLLNEQQQLEDQSNNLQNINQQLLQDNQLNEMNLYKNKDILTRLKKERKRDRDVLNS